MIAYMIQNLCCVNNSQDCIYQGLQVLIFKGQSIIPDVTFREGNLTLSLSIFLNHGSSDHI